MISVPGAVPPILCTRRRKIHKTSVTVTRFAPSPNGALHLGHAYSAVLNSDLADRADGRFLVRMEDIDVGRSQPKFETAILEDLAWLGLEWETPVRRQSEHFADYQNALARLNEMAVLYPCFCTRKEIQAEIEHSNQAPHGPLGTIYPGTCRKLSTAERGDRLAAGDAHALRLDVSKALDAIASHLLWREISSGTPEDIPCDLSQLGDVVLARKDVPTSYHLAVTIDDHLQNVTLIVRGRDLFHATHVHRLLQGLLGLNTPDYWHHGLIDGPEGDKLSKRKGAPTLKSLRDQNINPEEIRRMVGLNRPP